MDPLPDLTASRRKHVGKCPRHRLQGSIVYADTPRKLWPYIFKRFTNVGTPLWAGVAWKRLLTLRKLVSTLVKPLGLTVSTADSLTVELTEQWLLI